MKKAVTQNSEQMNSYVNLFEEKQYSEKTGKILIFTFP